MYGVGYEIHFIEWYSCMYTCLRTHHHKLPFVLTVNPPEFTQHPYSMSVATAIDITFKVKTTGECLHFRWQKDCIDLSNDNRYRDTDTDTFHISKVEKSDNKASYRCHIKNNLDEKFSKGAVLTVIKLNIVADDVFYYHL